VLALLQNQWFKDTQQARRVLQHYLDRGRPRHSFNHDMLFLRSLTGCRLRKAFGRERCEGIVWEESSDEITDNPSKAVKPNVEHIRRVLAAHKFDVLLLFGAVALRGWREATESDASAWSHYHILVGPHPAARGGGVKKRLDCMAVELGRLEQECA
jgi:hypothetical protein